MAERTIRICDVCMTVDGEGDSPEAVAVRTIEILKDDKPALLDVCAGHDKEYTQLLEKVSDFQRAATPVMPPARTGSDRAPRDPAVIAENKAIRAWVQEQGEQISERGRISDELRARYRAAVLNGDAEPVPTPA